MIKATGSARPLYAFSVALWALALILVPAVWPMPSSTAAPVLIFVGALAGMFCFFVAAGLTAARSPLGILRSGRNTYSLSRLQMVLWTWLVLSALVAIAACRAAGIGGSLATALDMTIPNSVLVVMGISYFSATAAPAILALRAQASTPPPSGQVDAASRRMGEPVNAIGTVMHRSPTANPRLSDLITGDDIATAGIVDLSKVQQLLITLLLVGAYFVMLLGLFAKKDMSGLPEFKDNFTTLLAVSHAGYLTYKAAPRPSLNADSGPATLRPPSPDRHALTP